MEDLIAFENRHSGTENVLKYSSLFLMYDRFAVPVLQGRMVAR
jgi:hypothetical protein